jgi:hypothetical protein
MKKESRFIAFCILAVSLFIPACSLGQFVATTPTRTPGHMSTSQPIIIIQSASATPEVLMNGDTLKIVVDTGEPDLVVTADLSGLDSTQPDPVKLSEVPGGTYKLNLDLSFGNTAGNGTKRIPIKIARASGETAETSVEVELANSPAQLGAVLLDDDFSGSTLDLGKWKKILENGGKIILDGGLVASTSNKYHISQARIESVWRFAGDFDVQVDFKAGPDWGKSATGHMNEAVLGTHIDSYSFEIVRLSRSPGEGGHESIFASSDHFTSQQEKLSAAEAGQFRLVRHGTTLFLLADLGHGWEAIGKMTVPDGPASIYLGNISTDASTTCTTFFKNFHINNGITSP